MVTSLSLFGLRTRTARKAAALSGMAQFIGYTGAAAGPRLVGVLHHVVGGCTLPLVLLAVARVLVAIFATLSGRPRHIT